MLAVMLLALVVVVAGVKPTQTTVETHCRHWEDFVIRGDKAIFDDFAEDVRFCWAGKCTTGKKEVQKLVQGWFELHLEVLKIAPSNLVLEEGMAAFQWTDFAKKGKCEEFLRGGYVLYYNEQGKMKEVHDYPYSEDEFNKALATFSKCAPSK
eukprot:Sspe_Gene.9145::Locus_3079_Transcript_1_2_Confidence_0.667_Length_701::g.9145::m.9145